MTGMTASSTRGCMNALILRNELQMSARKRILSKPSSWKREMHTLVRWGNVAKHVCEARRSYNLQLNSALRIIRCSQWHLSFALGNRISDRCLSARRRRRWDYTGCFHSLLENSLKKGSCYRFFCRYIQESEVMFHKSYACKVNTSCCMKVRSKIQVYAHVSKVQNHIGRSF